MSWAGPGTPGVPSGLVVRHPRGAGDLGVAGALRVVLGPVLRVEELTIKRGEKTVGSQSVRSHLVVVLGEMTMMDHAVPSSRPPAPGPSRAGRHRLLLGVVDAGLAVQAGGVRAGAVQAARHPGRPLLLQQLGDYRLHGLGCLVK